MAANMNNEDEEVCDGCGRVCEPGELDDDELCDWCW